MCIYTIAISIEVTTISGIFEKHQIIMRSFVRIALIVVCFRLVASQSLHFAVMTSFKNSTLGQNCSAVLQEATNKLKNASLLSSNVTLSCRVLKTKASALYLKVMRIRRNHRF